MKALITGSMGFVGTYLRNELEENDYDVYGIDLQDGYKTFSADLLDFDKTTDVLKQISPDVIFHLAAQADVGKSWNAPQQTIETNVIGAINILEYTRKFSPETKIVIVGSSDQYGKTCFDSSGIQETAVLNPSSPYALSKITQENFCLLYHSVYGTHVVMTRSFNHSGAGQKRGFIIPDFCWGISEIEKGNADCLYIGNLDSERDFSHVKDIVRAYRLLAEKGRDGEIYNVGSGTSVQIRTILEKLIKISGDEIKVVPDKKRQRPSDIPEIRCNHEKLTSDTGWIPLYSIDDILSDTLDYYRRLSNVKKV